MRQTLSDTGAPLDVIDYDPWGIVESGSVPTFGFTGELQSGGLVNLRARWYSTARGTLTSRDPFAGVAETPYSQHPYQYGYSDPVGNTDPSGRAVKDDSSGGGGRDTCRAIGWIWVATFDQPESGRCLPPAPPPTNEVPKIPMQPVSRNPTADPESGAQLPSTQGINLTDITWPDGVGRSKPRVPPGIIIVGGGAILLACLNALERVGPITWPRQRSEPDQYLYHYTPAENIPNIIKEGLKPSIAIPGNPKSDANFGDGQYLTDLTPTDASSGTMFQVGRALFNQPFHWGRRTRSDIGYIKIKVNDLPYQRVAPLFSRTFGDRGIYYIPGQDYLPLADRVVETGLVIFRPTDKDLRGE